MASSLVKTQLRDAVQQDRVFSKTGALQRIFAQRFENLVYAQIWEDPCVDMEALDISGDDHIVCIASGGCNVMSYLTQSPGSIDSLDLSPAHVALTRLKLIAARELDHFETFYRLFGHADRTGNRQLIENRLLPHMDEESSSYWTGHWGLQSTRSAMFDHGVYKYGLLGRFIGITHVLGRLTGVKLDEFLSCTSLVEQRAFYREKVEPALNNRIVKWLVNNRAALFGLGIPPQQYDALAGAAEGDIHAVLKDRVETLMCGFPLSENYFAWQAFNRGYRSDGLGPVPPYLQVEHYKTLQQNTDRVRVFNRSFTDYLKQQPAQSKTIYVLLDAQDWMNDTQLKDLWVEITRTAVPGARVIFRTAGLETILPGRVDDSTLELWNYDEERSRTLHARDRSAIYGGFHVYRLSDQRA